MMVEHRTSLETLVMQAWRERWTEIEWSVALKAALAEDSSEIDKLCGLLIKRATLSEVPNKLMFNYLSFTIASQVVSHWSLLQAVVDYEDFRKELCVEAIMDVLNLVRERLKCTTLDAFHCRSMCSVLTKLLVWLAGALEYSINHCRQNMTGQLIRTMMAFVYNPFISVCLYLHQLDEPDSYAELRGSAKAMEDAMGSLEWLCDSFKQDFRTLVNRIDDSSQIFSQSHSTGLNGAPQPTVISLSVLYGSVFLAEPLEAPVDALKNVREVQRLEWPEVIRDFIRGSLLLQQDCGSSAPETHLTAFVYLRIPRMINELVQGGVLAREELVEALTQVAHFHSLFNSLDMKARCDCFYSLLSELQKLRLLTDGEMAGVKDIRSRDKSPLTDASPGNQANITLVLKAEPTLQTLLKSFHSEFAQKQDKLVQMMHHMISGKSFEFICAAAAATGRLSTFTGKLIDFNESSKRPHAPDERPENALLRSELFDLSFSLLSRIVQLYGCSPVTQNASARGTFFESWCSRFIDIGRRVRRESGGSGTEPVWMASEEDKRGEQCNDAEQYAEMVQKLKSSQQGWTANSNGEWHAICEQVPRIGERLLAEFSNDQISQEELKGVFSGLVLINANGSHWVCSLLLCLSQWLVSCTASEERRRLAGALHSFVDSTCVHSSERTKADRQTFMSNVSKRLLGPLLAPAPVPNPPYQWLNSVRRQVQCQTAVTGLLLPPLDTIRHYLSSALKQGWMTSSALSIIQRCQKLGEHKLWIKLWFDELSKLSATEELNLWCDICTACCFVDPAVTLVHFVEMLAVFVLEPGRELFCVAPRGACLSRLLVQLYLLGYRLISSSSCDEQPAVASSNPDEPKQKLRKTDSPSDGQDWSKLRDSLSNALNGLYRRFSMICDDGDLRPAVFFVGSFLRCLAEYRTTEARCMMSKLPSQLIGLLIRTDPRILTAPVILALTDLNEKNERVRALQNLCLLRHMKAL